MAQHIRDLLEVMRRRYGHSREPNSPPARFVTGVAGGVAAGKSTFAETLKEGMEAWPERPIVQIVPTDGYLLSNQRLAERNLSLRKGFPDSYDVEALRLAVAAMRSRARLSIPRYSHVTYDIDPLSRDEIDAADIVILDGLHLRLLQDAPQGRLIDLLIYLDADEADIERWFHNRLVPLMQAGRSDPGSFYYAFRTLDDDAVRAFSQRVWNGINLPNLREHIIRDREAADVVVRKHPDHGLAAIAMRT